MRTITLQMDGNQICATWDDFDCLAVSPAGFGNNITEAVVDLIKETKPYELNGIVTSLENGDGGQIVMELHLGDGRKLRKTKYQRRGMKEIKFRAWDKINKVMVHRFLLSSKQEGNIITDNTDFVLMQFTGLHDKNGKEVFEGDIINGNVIQYHLLIMGQIVFDDHFHSYGAQNDAGITPLYEIDSIEVIGNIYENGDLLKEGK